MPSFKNLIPFWLRLRVEIQLDRSLTLVETIAEIPYVLSHCDPSRQSRILVFGSFNDLSSVMLASLGNDVVGFDLRTNPLTHPNLTMITGNFLETSRQFPDSSFDIAIAIHSLQHAGMNIYKGPKADDLDRQVVKRIRSLLKDHAIFLLTVPFGRPGLYPKSKPVYRKYDRKLLAHLLEGYDFEVTRFTKELSSGKWLPADDYEGLEDAEDEVRTVACIKALPRKLVD